MPSRFNKPYNPKEVENKIYRLWEKSGYFNPDKLPSRHKKPFTIIMPPPNANGSLHLGHALMNTLEDVMIRYKRMKGLKTLWLPGADHAGFETQVVYEKKLEKEGRSRFEIPREQLWQEMWDFTQTNKKIMENQLRRLGASCDWSREKFTLDKDIIKVVYETFKKLYDDGLIYRDKRIVNFCIKHQTALSDLEVSWEEKEDNFYYIKYVYADNRNKHILIATVRPETIPGDIAVAVNPDDTRYENIIGKEVIEPITGKKIPVIADKLVDMKFGTGALKITPAHDAVDFEIAKNHNLNPYGISVIDRWNGRLNALSGPLQGLKIIEAREKAIEILKSKNLLDKTEPYKHQIGVCYKCKNVLEPTIMPQWFVRMTKKPESGGLSLKDAAVKSVKSGKIKLIPKRFEKIFFYWMKNLRDWNISRQIVWGIQIPAFFCKDCGEVAIAKETPKVCLRCKSKNIERDPDVFDTWFSSGQWPFATLMTNKPNDYKIFYPTSVMETGWDILFFWVTRMLMLGIYRTGKIPFEYVYLHGLVRDKDKQKMSKSKGNVVDPLGVVNEYGADALRMALIVGNTPGNDLAYSEDKVRGYRNFANKIWQAARFVLLNTQNCKKTRLTARDKKRLQEFNKFKKKIAQQMDAFKFYIAAEEIYHYFWHTFADKIIEESKNGLRGDDLSVKKSAQYLIYEILTGSLKLLHPFMPFITEEIWQSLPILRDGSKQVKYKKLLIIKKW